MILTFLNTVTTIYEKPYIKCSIFDLNTKIKLFISTPFWKNKNQNTTRNPLDVDEKMRKSLISKYDDTKIKIKHT